jgi:hypothetical protein
MRGLEKDLGSNDLAMFHLIKPRHLRYHSIEEWMENEQITTLTHSEDPALQDRLFQQFGELRKHLWEQHIVHLTPEERRQLEAGEHPSQSHSRAKQASGALEEFRTRLARLPYVAEVSMGMYHMDRIIFGVKLSQDVGWRTWRKDIPAFFRGFEVLVLNAPNKAHTA